MDAGCFAWEMRKEKKCVNAYSNTFVTGFSLQSNT